MSAAVQVSETDVEALEIAGDALMRSHAVDSALAMYALALRLRMALNPDARELDFSANGWLTRATEDGLA